MIFNGTYSNKDLTSKVQLLLSVIQSSEITQNTRSKKCYSVESLKTFNEIQTSQEFQRVSKKLKGFEKKSKKFN